jgi:hypothetical protein
VEKSPRKSPSRLAILIWVPNLQRKLESDVKWSGPKLQGPYVSHLLPDNMHVKQLHEICVMLSTGPVFLEETVDSRIVVFQVLGFESVLYFSWGTVKEFMWAIHILCQRWKITFQEK